MTFFSSSAISRRQFLLVTGAITLAGTTARVSRACSRAFVTSETGALRKALVNPASAAAHGYVMRHLDPFWRDAAAEVVAQHSEMMLQLQAAGSEIQCLGDVLDGAIAEAKWQHAWAPWLDATFPELTDTDRIQGATLLAQDRISCAGHAMDGLTYLRDFAVMLPRGLALGNVGDPHRARQTAVFRLMVAYAPEFRGYPVVFDAQTEGLRLEGGDLQVLDANTLLVGVGNHTDAGVGPRLARATDMNVIAVNIANSDPAKWPSSHDPLRDFFFHLDTVVAQVAPRHVAVLPWLFEVEHTGAADRGLISEFGRVKLYRAGSGVRDRSVENLKLVDYLRGLGFRISYIGAPERQDLQLLRADAARSGAIFPRRERQGANMLALAPGLLLAFPGAARTHAALRDDGASVVTVGNGEMWRGYGGPHCFTLPLERA